ncbi:hypothetical protein [Beijerinckia mobilis]|uniref:hypothetical protein n=1 Tax=Beijerinckia mobilis TaxID=231434 RepID=UPI000550CB69|nr:hypothetical protein [Beijerinckia mobilis]
MPIPLIMDTPLARRSFLSGTGALAAGFICKPAIGAPQVTVNSVQDFPIDSVSSLKPEEAAKLLAACAKATDNRAAFQSAFTEAQKVRGTTIVVPPGVHYIRAGAIPAQTLLAFKGMVLQLTKGATLVFDGWGCPLFAAINTREVTIEGEGTIVYAGTYFDWHRANTQPQNGSAYKFGYGAILNYYEWCAAIACCGTDTVRISDISIRGLNYWNELSYGIFLQGQADLVSRSHDIWVTNVNFDDFSQGIGTRGIEAKITGCTFGRAGNASSHPSYKIGDTLVRAGPGPGHALYQGPLSNNYFPSSLTIHGLVDKAIVNPTYDVYGTTWGGPSGHTFSLKGLFSSTLNGCTSARQIGLLNFCALDNVTMISNTWTNDTGLNNFGYGVVMAVNADNAVNRNVTFKNLKLLSTADNDITLLQLGQLSSAEKNVNMVVDGLYARRSCYPLDGAPWVNYVGKGGSFTAIYDQTGTANKPNVALRTQDTSDNSFTLKATGGNSKIRILNPDYGTNNLFQCGSGSTYLSDYKPMGLAKGNQFK